MDFFVKLGDTIYADIASPAVSDGNAKTLGEYRAKHQEVYGSHQGMDSFADLQRTIPAFATIDDHEVINDFAGGSETALTPALPIVNQTQLNRNGLQAFIEHKAVANTRYPKIGDPLTDGRPDFYQARRYGKTASISLLDARSFRDGELPGVADLTNPAEIGRFISRSFDVGKK